MSMSLSLSEGTRILDCILIFVSVFLILALAFLLLMIIRKYTDTIKSFWQPPLTIPSHYEEVCISADLQYLIVVSLSGIHLHRTTPWRLDTFPSFIP